MIHDEMIALIQAHKEGKPIQFRIVGGKGWLDSPGHLHLGPNFDFEDFEYRIKPEPRKAREYSVRLCVGKNNGLPEIAGVNRDWVRCSTCEVFYVREVLNHEAEVNPETKTSGACSLERAF